MEDRIMDIVMGKVGDEVTWRSMIMDLVKSEGMDPWDVDISALSKKYSMMLKKLTELDFKVSGKMVLAAAMLLKLKSNRLVGEEMAELDRLMSSQDEDNAEGFYDDLESSYSDTNYDEGTQPLIPRTPQPRKRKVSIYDLMISLQKALEVRDRRVVRSVPYVNVKIPERKVDMSNLINDVFGKVSSLFKVNKTISFSQLVPVDASKETKVLTFMPLLHLANADYRKIDMSQDEHFGEIVITLPVKASEQPRNPQPEET
jgi:segregation and condensation protein A